jgi:hypothetical protein
VGVAINDGGAEVEGFGGDQAQLVGELIDAVGFGADQAMLARNKTEKGCQFQIAKCVDLVEKLFIRHFLHLLVAVTS